MSNKALVDAITKEVMNVLKSDANRPSVLPSGTEINVSGKTVVFLLPNVDINISSFLPLLTEFKKKNIVKAIFPKWGRTYASDTDLGKNNIDISYMDYSNVANAKSINGDIFIVPVNNDNVLRKLAKLDKGNAYLAALATSQAMNGTVFLIPSGDYEPSSNLKTEIGKTRIKLCTIIDIQKSYVSAVAPRPASTFTIPTIPSTNTTNNQTQDEEYSCFTCTTHTCISKCLSKAELMLKTGADRIGTTLGNTDFPLNIAHLIDHTLLKPEATVEQVTTLCEEAKKYTFASVCINPGYVELSAKLLKGTPVKVCTVIGFPLGATTSETKAFETRQAIAQGADEIDMVINVGALKSKDYAKVEEDIRTVVQACNGKTLKVIFETGLLTKEEKIKACELSVKAGANFVKTSTGFGAGGATEEDIALMRAMVGPDLGVKASGGIRDTETTLKMLKAGANRIGASASVGIVTNQKPADKNSKY